MNDNTDKTRKLFDALTSASGLAKQECQRAALAGAALDRAKDAYMEASERKSRALDAEADAREALSVHLELRK